MEKTFAPWRETEVAALNRAQRLRRIQPFTCSSRSDKAHRQRAVADGEPDNGILVAETDGWRCPVCGYRQSWAWGFMLGA